MKNNKDIELRSEEVQEVMTVRIYSTFTELRLIV